MIFLHWKPLKYLIFSTFILIEEAFNANTDKDFCFFTHSILHLSLSSYSFVLPIRPLKDIEADYPNEWIILEVTKMAGDEFTPLEGRLIAYNKDRDALQETVKEYCKKHEVRTTYHNFTGDMQVEAVLL